MKTRLSRQEGMSAPAMLLLLLVVVAAGTFAIKTIPSYLDYNTIDGAINAVLKDPKLGLKSVREIRTDIGKRLDINNIDVIDKNQIRIEKNSGRVYVAIDYKVRKDLFKNMDLVMHFEKEYEQSVL